jgi:protocadherin-16/23
VSGNKQNAFRLSSQRDKEGGLMLDLIVNGFLDREAVPTYSLLIEAVDGGSPPQKGALAVNVTILDLNDNPPTFEQQRYHATLAENATVGTSVLSVTAADPDSGPNGEVTYAINRRQSDSQELFAIDELSGLLTVNKRLDFESKDSHELVVVAKDRGDVPQETTAFITVRITDVNDNQPRVGITFRTPGGAPELREDAPVGQHVADLAVLVDEKQQRSSSLAASTTTAAKFAGLTLTVAGQGSEHFSLERKGGGWELVLVRQLDREQLDRFNLVFEAVGEEPETSQPQLRKLVTCSYTYTHSVLPDGNVQHTDKRKSNFPHL